MGNGINKIIFKIGVELIESKGCGFRMAAAAIFMSELIDLNIIFFTSQANFDTSLVFFIDIYREFDSLDTQTEVDDSIGIRGFCATFLKELIFKVDDSDFTFTEKFEMSNDFGSEAKCLECEIFKEGFID